MSTAPTRRQLLLGGGHLAAVWTLAFAQPLLDLLGRSPDFFVARDNTPGDVLLLAFGLTLLPPLVLLAIEWAVSLVSSRAYNLLHLTLLGGISAFFFIQVVSKVFDWPTIPVIALAVGLGCLFAWAVYRSDFVRNLIDILIAAPVVVLALFIFISPAKGVIFPGEEAARINPARGEDRPIVLVIFDELGTGDLMTDRNSIDARRFPNFARFTREATWYRNQSTTSPFTPQAVPGILTGQSLPGDTLPTSWNMPDNIFTLLSRDRPVHVKENVTKLCPVSLCPQNAVQWRQLRRLKALWSDLKYVEGRLVLPPGLADRLPAVDGKFQGFGGSGSGEDGPTPFRDLVANHGRGSRNSATIDQFIREIPNSSRGMTVMHLALPHHEWRYTTDGRLYNWEPQSGLGSSSGRWEAGKSGVATAQARMYVQTGFADRLLGELRRTLIRKGLWNEAIVVISADHGISFKGGRVPRRQASPQGMGEIGNPPLLIKYPGQRRGETVTGHSMTIDILPTISQAVGINPTYQFDGIPLQQGELPSRPVTLQSLTGPPVSTSLRVMVAQRNEAIARADRRLGTGPLFTLGPAPELIGRKVPPGSTGTGVARLDTPELWHNVRPLHSRVPINVTGSLPSGKPGTVVAISVNGVIRGTATAFAYDGAVRFGALVNPVSLQRGRNAVGIFKVEGGRLLRP